MAQPNGFTQNADLYRTSKAHSELPDLEAVEERLPPVAGSSCLDVATGTGHTAFFFAKKHAHVFAVDINDEMLRVAQEESDRLSLSVRFLKSPADDLMFDDDNFDLVTCRLAAHHFADVNGFVAEVARVLKTGAHFLLIDNVVPDDQVVADWLNAFESERDPSHQRCLARSDWERLLAGHAFQVVHTERFSKKLDFKAWMGRMSLPVEAQNEMWQKLCGASEEVKNYWNPREDEEGRRFLTLRRQIFLSRSD